MVFIDKDGKIISSQYSAMDKLPENILGENEIFKCSMT
jgi:hypothetical protein